MVKPRPEIPLEVKKWLCYRDIERLYPEISIKVISRMAIQGTWPVTKEKNPASGMRSTFIERDAFDDWVEQNGIPIKQTAWTGPKKVFKRVPVIRRRVYRLGESPTTTEPLRVAREHGLRSSEVARASYDATNPPTRKNGTENQLVVARYRLAVENRRLAKPHPRRLLHWNLVNKVLQEIVKAGGPSGSGDDLEELRRVLSIWVHETFETHDQKIWETPQVRRRSESA